MKKIDVVKRYSISNFFASKICELENYKICIICDDSGSMSLASIPFETRWSEVQEAQKIIVDISSIFDKPGIDIYYLNREPIINVCTSEDLYNYEQFLSTPYGFTPLGETIERVIQDTLHCEKTILLIIFTDGEPNNINLFNNTLKNRDYNKILISIVACTNDKNTVIYLDNLDAKIKNVYVCDNFDPLTFNICFYIW